MNRTVEVNDDLQARVERFLELRRRHRDTTMVGERVAAGRYAQDAAWRVALDLAEALGLIEPDGTTVPPPKDGP